jgi:hypothetical protein
MNHVVQPQKPGYKRMTYLLQRKEVKVRWGEPPVETKHCMVIPCVVSRDEDSQIQYDIMIPKKFYKTVLDTQIVAKKYRHKEKTIWRPLVKSVSEAGFKPLFQRTDLNDFMTNLPDIEETDVDVEESNACTKEWLVNEMLMFPSTWLLERKKNKFSRENNEKVLMGFVLSEEAYATGEQELEKMQEHLGYHAIREYRYFFDGQPPMLIVEKSECTLRQAMQTDSMKFSTWNAQLCDGDTDTAEAEWKKVLRAVVAGCRYMAIVGGITHGNLCADNIVQTASGEWKITEFGSAEQRLDSGKYLDYVLRFGLELLSDIYRVPKEGEAATAVADLVGFINSFFSLSQSLEKELFSKEEIESMQEVEKKLSSKKERESYREELWVKLQPKDTLNKKRRR